MWGGGGGGGGGWCLDVVKRLCPCTLQVSRDTGYGRQIATSS